MNKYKILNDEEFKRLFKEARNGDRDAEDIIAFSYTPYILSIIKKEHFKMDNDKMLDVSYEAVKSCIRHYDETRNSKFHVYSGVAIKNRLISLYRTYNTKKNNNNIISLDSNITESGLNLYDIISVECNCEDDFLKNELYTNINYILAKLPEKEQYIISKTYGFNTKIIKQDEIARNLNLSQSQVSRLSKKALGKIKSYLIKMDLIEKKEERKIDLSLVKLIASDYINGLTFESIKLKYNMTEIKVMDLFKKYLNNKELELIENISYNRKNKVY